MDAGQIVGIVSMAIATPLYLISACLYFFRRQYEPIKSRGIVVPYCQSAMGYVHIVVLSLEFFDIVPCPVSYFSVAFFIPLWMFPYFLRASYLLSSYMWNLQQLLRSKRKEIGRTEAKNKRKSYHLVERFRFAASFKFQLSIYLTVVTIFLIISIILYFEVDSKEYLISGNCRNAQTILSTVETAIAAVMLVSFTFFLWRIEDEVWIKKELRICVFNGMPLFILWGIGTFTNYFPRALTIGFLFLAIGFSHIYGIVCPLILTYYWRSKLKKAPNDESQLRLFGKKDPMLFVFEHEILLKSFETFCVKTFCVENILFLKATKKYVDKFQEENKYEMAQEIAQNFLGHDARYEVNIDEGITFVILEKIRRNEIDIHLFEDAEKEIFVFIRFGTFEFWKSSDMYKKTLQQLNVQNLADLTERDPSTSLTIESFDININ